MNLPIRNIILLVLMLASAGLAVAMRPTQKIADLGPAIELKAVVPTQFGNWREEEQSGLQVVDPSQAALINKIYSQTLTRSYVRSDGYRVMLSIAYGSDQTDGMQVHKPEICYPAQGFVLEGKSLATLSLPSGQIPVVRVLTSAGRRIEPITYWTTVGDKVVGGGINKKLIEMSYGLTGKIPDGMLIRISSIDGDSANAYTMHDQFAAEMLKAIAPEYRQRFSGNLN